MLSYGVPAVAVLADGKENFDLVGSEAVFGADEVWQAGDGDELADVQHHTG